MKIQLKMTNSNSLTFTIEDILEFFIQNNGSVVYSNIVTHFKSALSDPQTRGKSFIVN